MSTDNELYGDFQDQTGQTSGEVAMAPEQKRSRFDLTVFEVMLLIALICITLASLLMVFELRNFGDFPGGFPWRTEEVLVN